MKNKNTKLTAAVILALTLLLTAVSCGECKHTYEDGACTLCGVADPDYEAPCKHTYEDGTCTLCGVADPDYEAPCKHTYEDGACTLCGEVCKHSFADGVCTVCGTACIHGYLDGACVNCGISCAHVYIDGVCVKCSSACAHEYKDGVCAHCSAEDPDYIPADGGRSLYGDIVKAYKELVLYKFVNEELPPRSDGEPFYTDALYEVVGQFDPTKNFGYAYKDINGDGYVELFLVENSNRLYALFTLKEKFPALVTTFQQGMGYLTSDGTLFYNSKRFSESGGQIFLACSFSRLTDGRLVGISYGWEDGDGDYATSGDEVYYRTAEDGSKTVLTYDEYKSFKAAYNYYWEAPTRLTKLADLKASSALTDTYLTDIVADFSDYDGIIKTFGLMHTAVTGGKCVRSKWIAGAYDNGMHFESESNFIIYNKLFAASTLVQKKETATFGYARRDLNGDGTEELILLESSYHVLAVFTELDGRAVLLDSYTDHRTAFIDKDGNIHVRERKLPGTDADIEYFVYEIKDGALNARVAIGVRDGMCYKLTDGVAVPIEKSEWDTLYAEYALDIGEGAFNTYTKENSTLVFTAAAV